MMVRTAFRDPVLLSELMVGKQIDGLVLQKGDHVLLTQQANTADNTTTGRGWWARPPPSCAAPPST